MYVYLHRNARATSNISNNVGRKLAHWCASSQLFWRSAALHTCTQPTNTLLALLRHFTYHRIPLPAPTCPNLNVASMAPWRDKTKTLTSRTTDRLPETGNQHSLQYEWFRCGPPPQNLTPWGFSDAGVGVGRSLASLQSMSLLHQLKPLGRLLREEALTHSQLVPMKLGQSFARPGPKRSRLEKGTTLSNSSGIANGKLWQHKEVVLTNQTDSLSCRSPTYRLTIFDVTGLNRAKTVLKIAKLIK